MFEEHVVSRTFEKTMDVEESLLGRAVQSRGVTGVDLLHFDQDMLRSSKSYCWASGVWLGQK